MQIFVLDHNKKQRNPIHPAIARKLLKRKGAAIYKRYPFTIILNPEARLTLVVEPIRLKLDPGAKTTGIALVQGNRVIWAAELTHRGFSIRESLTARRAIRRGRRTRNTRYRQPRFLNRTRPQGWLAPSLTSRVYNILTWVKRLQKVCNITDISQELVKFDMQKMRNPEIAGVEYQQGSLMGYELREYMLEKWKRECAYCEAKNTPLEIEHIHSKAKGDSNSITNLTLACHECNQKKGEKDIIDFLKKKPEVLKKILAVSKNPLADAAAVNSTRWILLGQLKDLGLPVETGTGGMTKFNRCQQDLPKTHWLDAVCVGVSTPKLKILVKKPLLIKATGHGTRQLCRTDKFGFPSRYVPRFKFVKGFQTGDIVKAIVTSGKKLGTYVGRVAVRSKGSFNISTAAGLIDSVSHKYCKIVHKKDGYGYSFSTGQESIPCRFSSLG